MDGILLSLFWILALLYSIIIHEVSHGLVADNLGDPTARSLGRLSLNPIRHLDLFGSIILPFLTWFAGGFIFGYAKPVPYNPMLLSDKKWGPAKIAIAGPLSNIVLALIFGMAIRFMPDVFATPLIPNLLQIIVVMNLVLAVFNLMPIPPLDGHWLLLSVLPQSLFPLMNFLYRNSFLILLVFIILIFPFIVSPIVGFLYTLITGVAL